VEHRGEAVNDDSQHEIVEREAPVIHGPRSSTPSPMNGIIINVLSPDLFEVTHPEAYDRPDLSGLSDLSLPLDFDGPSSPPPALIPVADQSYRQRRPQLNWNGRQVLPEDSESCHFVDVVVPRQQQLREEPGAADVPSTRIIRRTRPRRSDAADGGESSKRVKFSD
jgi:hypothetical protein